MNLKIAFRASIGVIVGIFILIFIISIILSSLYSKIAPEYFGNPIESIYTVFRMFTIEGWYDIPNAIADNTSPLIGTISKIAFCLIVLIGGMFGMSFVTSSFTDELAVDNNDNVMKELQELKEMIKNKMRSLGITISIVLWMFITIIMVITVIGMIPFLITDEKLINAIGLKY